MVTDKVLAEAKRLYDEGFAIHWLHKESKRPIETGWTTGPRKDWTELKKTYSKNFNVGVRLGQPSKIQNKFLGVIDGDLKSDDPKHLKEFRAALLQVTENEALPEVASGRGNGSTHLYILTPSPVLPKKVMQSPDVVKVYMPSASPSKKELKQLTGDEIKAGLRLRRAWEIALMGEGQQVVLPPSVHPDSGKNYAWTHGFDAKKAAHFNLSHLDFEDGQGVVEKSGDNVEKPKPKVTEAVTFKVSPVDLGWLPISDKIRDMIIDGTGVEDRSAMLLPVANALVQAGLNQNEVLTVLTDPDYFMGLTGYEHAQTKSRDRAAAWVFKYTLKKVLDERSAAKRFETPIVEPVKLTPEEIAEEAEAFETEEKDFRFHMDTTEKGNYRTTLNNTVLVIRNHVAKDVVKRDLFSYRDFYNQDTPWGGVKGAALNDDDVTKIKLWISEKWGFEPSANTVGEALTIFATSNSFDPVKDSLEALPEWDGVERLDTWLVKYFHGEGHHDYLAQVFRKWMVAMVMRIYEPGAKFDWMPIFEGPQGAGKSSFGKILVGDKYFLDWLPDLANKDAALSLQGVWAVEMGELAQFRKAEIEIVKAFVSRQIDKVRPPYGQRWLESPRRCVFFGTTNFDTYLRDESGNRRFKPVKVGKLNFDQLEQDRTQLFAEALYLYKNGFEYLKHLDIEGEAQVYEKTIQLQKMVQDDSALMTEAILDFIEKENLKSNNERFDFTKFQLKELFKEGSKFLSTPPLENWKYETRTAMLAGKALKSLGFEKRGILGINYWRRKTDEK